MSQVSRFVEKPLRLFSVDLSNNKPEMPSHFVFSHETGKALEIRMVRVRMEARRAAQSDAWGAILRIAWKDIDFELDDLVALEARAEAEAEKRRWSEW